MTKSKSIPAPVSTSLASKVEVLKERARMLARVREFFAQRDVMEVDTPLLSHTAPIDVHIEIMSVASGHGEKGYLHSSPEYAMKRLLSEGCGDIYQLSHVFRAENAGRLHNPEFMMIEWYRRAVSLDFLMQETLDLISLFVGELPVQVHTYAKLFEQVTGCDYRTASLETLKKLIEPYSPPADCVNWDVDTCLHFLMGFMIEPTLKGLHLMCDYPPSQAALATTKISAEGLVAERFEVYFNGIELANGFHELTEAQEQRRRLIAANVERQTLGRSVLPLDERFLAALERGLPDSCGVAVGFDRLLMLKLGKTSLKDVVPFSWEEI
jgi:elongation factor P--(R)-beta-lysine ligase